MSDFKSKSILLYFSLAFIFLSFAIAPVSAEIKEDATIRGYHDILYTNIIESAFNNNPEVITVNSYLDYNSSIDVSLSGSPNTLVTKSFVEDLVESIELDSPYYNLVANRASVNSNHRHELRIPWPSTHSGPLILDVEVLVDTNSVATRHYKVKRFYLTTISSSNPGEIYSQNSFVLNSLGGSTGTYNYIDIFREDTSSGDIVLDIYTSHNRALSVRVSAWGSDNVVDLVSDASFDANVENVGSIPSRADVELGLNDNVFVHNDLVVDGTSEFNDYLTLRG
ncbi:MAG: hypothetical protein ACMXX6_01305, partial [Candidatus Woesearchaeota archaeon]